MPLMSLETLLPKAALVAPLVCAACQRPAITDPRMVSEWMHTMYGTIRVIQRLEPARLQ